MARCGGLTLPGSVPAAVFWLIDSCSRAWGAGLCMSVVQVRTQTQVNYVLKVREGSRM